MRIEEGTVSKSRVALVTGGCSGIGLEISRRLLDQQVRVVAAARRANDGQYRAEVESQLPSAVITALDVCDTASVARCVEVARQTFGNIDIVVNSAGVSTYQPVAEHSEADWLQVIDTNLSGPFRVINACLPAMKAQGWGRIVNIASTAARTAVADSAAYSASKAGLLGLTRAVAVEGAPFGVSCVAVSPTWVETPMMHQSAATAAAQRGCDAADILEEIRTANPQQRLVQATEVAALVAFLCGEEAQAITMEDIQVNAGAHW
jgi:NAD(P)-dependent dehydrogenase (short-subunit alcohol dehydrogenase family)